MFRLLAKSIKILIFCGVMAFGAVFVQTKYMNEDAGFLMAATTNAVEIGSFKENYSETLKARYVSSLEFTPSVETVNRTTKHRLFQGAVPRSWYEYVPDTASDNMPVVILLHGAGRNGLSLIDIWRDLADRQGIALLAPNSLWGNWPLESPNPKFLAQAFSSMADRHKLNEDRVYLFGHSNGASYAQLLANSTLGPWKKAALHGGYWAVDQSIVPIDPKPMRYYLGMQDHLFTIPDARFVGQYLASKGHSVELVKIQQHTHWLYALGPEIAQDSWIWFEGTSKN